MQEIALQAFSYGKVSMLLVYKANNTMIELEKRDILKLFGDYEIVKSEDWGWDEEKDWPSSVVITTNLPWEEISKLHG